MRSFPTRPFILVILSVVLLTDTVHGQVRTVDEIDHPELPPFEIPEPTRMVLDNGMVVILVEDRELPLVNVVARFRTGSIEEPAERIGLASLTGTVMRTGGTRRMSPDELDEFLEGNAAVVETFIGQQFGGASMSCLREDFSEVFRVFSEVLREPAFAADRLEVARTQMTTSIARRNDNPQDILFREFSRVLYGKDSPFARIPEYATVEAIGREDLVEWHARHFHPNRIVLGLVGDFEKEEILDEVNRVLGDWPAGPEPEDPPRPPEREPEPGIYFIRKDDVTQTGIVMGHFGIVRDNPDFYAVEIMNRVLSGGFSSRLFNNIRSRRGLAYSVRGGVESGWRFPGIARLWMTTRTEATVEAIEALLEEARNLTSLPPTEEEVEFARTSILNSFVFESDSTRKILSQQLTFEFFGYPLDWLERYREGIEKVTVEEVRRAAERYVHPSRFSIVVVGPAGVDEKLQAFGDVRPVEITIPEPEEERAEATPAAVREGARWVEAAVEAMGGAEAVDAVEVLHEESSVTAVLPQGEMEVETRTWISFPDRMRQELILPFGTLVTVLSPHRSFVVTPQGVEDLPESQLEDRRLHLFRNPTGFLKARRLDGFRVVAAGPAEIDGVGVERLEVEVEGGSFDVSIESDSGRILEITYRGTDFTGTPGRVSHFYSDFREVDGLIYPFSTRSTIDGRPLGTSTVRRIELNPRLPEELFEEPRP